MTRERVRARLRGSWGPGTAVQDFGGEPWDEAQIRWEVTMGNERLAGRDWALAPKGECHLRNDEYGRIYVDRADPRILISDELVEQWRTRHGLFCHPAVTLDGDAATIRAANRTVVYRLTEHVPEWRAWTAEWPD